MNACIKIISCLFGRPHRVAVITGICCCFCSLPATAGFMLNTDLTGDPRPDNPDNLLVHVSTTVQDGSLSIASWEVDLDSLASHPDMKLDEFFFNLDLPPGTKVAFSNPMPNDSPGKVWAIDDGNNAQGSGSADFDFGVGLTGGGSPMPNQVNNAVDLAFQLQLLTDDISMDPVVWMESYFTGADASESSDAILGSGQMGAHLQSLVAVGNESTSGFVLGNHDGEEPPPIRPPNGEVPEPASLAVWSVLCIGFSAAHFVRRRKNVTVPA